MKLRSLVLLFAAILPSLAADPPGSDKPAAAPRNVTACNVSLQFDWIRIPHLMANQLIRQHLKHTREGEALYKAAQELIAQKKAERLDFTTLVVRGGQRSKSESIIEKPYPTDDPPSADARVPTTGSNFPVLRPRSFYYKNLGLTVEVEATVGEDGITIDLNMALQWVEHLADVSWGTGVSEVKQPAFGADSVTTQVLVESGTWQMVALLTPPHGAPDGKPLGTVLPAERVLLFARAANSKQRKPGPAADSGVKQVTVLAEWIETDAALASDLLAKYPAFADSVALREALEPMLNDGSAALLESSAVQVRGGQRSKVESVTEFPYPSEFDPPQVAGNSFDQHRKLDSHFDFKHLGVTLEAEVTVGENGLIDLNLSPELVFNNGTDSFGQGASEHKQARFQTLKTSLQLLVLPNSPALAGSFDAPLLEGKALPAVRPRKVLLFVRAIL